MTEPVEETSLDRIQAEPRARPPATGERSAAVGFSAQYLVAAELILDELLGGGLEWIRVADPSAGSVDDIVIGTDGRADAYQIKWSQYAGTFTFKDLTQSRGGSPSLLTQLAEGWKACKQEHPSRRVVVHLLTNRHPSSNDVLRTDLRPNHFAAFISQVWNHVSTAPLAAPFEVPQEWSQTWGAFREASGLSGEELRSFAQDCRLEFGRRTEQVTTLSNQVEDQFRQEDIDRLAHELLQIAADPGQIVHLPRDELIRRMGWEHRFSFNSAHRFPIDQNLYQPISATSDQLLDAIDELPSGYVALLGGPGTGKSSLLTETLKNVEVRVVRYYAYVPDAAGPTSLRGESVSFLHDVVTELDRLGFNAGQSTRRRDRVQLLSHFHQQLQMLHRDWKDSGKKSVVLIDGLDHIEREQQPERSLLADLPRSDEVPEGVYFVLGTQTTGCLPNHIRSTLTTETQRCVEMSQLSRQQVSRMITAAEIPIELTDEQSDRAFDLSDGHPLYTNYLINQLRTRADSEQINDLLEKSASYQGDIEVMYETNWSLFEEDFELQRLLGLLARMRRAIDMHFVAQWADPDVLGRLMLRFSHFFRTEEQNRWHFFHNSFRLFLVEKTRQIRPGQSNSSVEREFHLALAEYCADTAEGTFWSWEEMHYRIQARQCREVLELATQNYFRQQMLDLRPPDAIQTDLISAIRLAAESEDLVALVRLLLAGSELKQRQNFLDYLPTDEFLELLIGLGQIETAIEHIRDGNQLRIDEMLALQVSTYLARSGCYEEGSRVFTLAEPVEILTGDKSVSSAPFLIEWVRAAVVFKPIEKVVDQIRRIRYHEDTRRSDAETMTRGLRLGMFQTAGLALATKEKWDAVTLVADSFDPTERDEAIALFWFQFQMYEYAQSTCDDDRARQYVESMTDMNVSDLGDQVITALAEVVFRFDGDRERASELITNVSEPQFPSVPHYYVEDLKDYAHRIRFNRLVFALGDQRDASAFVPDAENPSEVGLVALERSICDLAQIWGRAWSGKVLDADTLTLLVLPLIQRFAESGQKIAEVGRWYYLNRTKTDFYALLVNAVSDHGHEALATLAGIFEQEWNDNERNWPISDRRLVIQSLYRRGIQRQWARYQLETFNSAQLNDFDVSERVEQNFRQAKAWFEIGDLAQAEEFLKRAVQTGFGVAYSKDFQLDRWIQWLGRINETDPTNAANRISKFDSAVEGLRYSIEWSPFRSACERLLTVTSMTSPVAAVRLMLRLIDGEMTGYQSAIRSLMKGALRSASTSTRITTEVFNELISPFDPEGDPQLTKELVHHIHNNGLNDGESRQICNLVSVIRRHGLPSARPKWLRGVVEGLEMIGAEDTRLGIGNEELGLVPDDISSSDRLTLKGVGEILYKDEVTRSASSVEELGKFMAAEDEESHFGWASVARRLANETRDLDELEDIMQLFANRRDASEVRSIVSERLSGLGSSERAWEVGVEALNGSSKWEWYERFGGARINAFEALASVDRVRAIPLIYGTIIADLEESPSLVTSIVEELASIVNLLDASDQTLPIWEEIEPYIGNLLSLDGASNDLGLFDEVLGDDNWDAALIMLMASYVDHPCLTLAQTAIRGLGKLLLEGEEGVITTLEGLLSESEGVQERVLMLLHALSAIDSDALAWAQGRVNELAESRNWSIRNRARAVAENCDWHLPTSKHFITPLPSVYSLLLPLNSRDVELTSPLTEDIDFVASIANVDRPNMYRRVVEAMESLAPRDDAWSENAEQKLASSLANTGLRLPYIKPRFRILRRALNHVMSELIDAGRIPGEYINLLGGVLRDYDPDMVLVEPRDRPTKIKPFADVEIGVDRHEWIANAGDSLPLTGLDRCDGCFMVAEATRLELIGDRRKLVENRYASIGAFASGMIGPALTREKLFGSVVKGLVSENPTANLGTALVVRNIDYGYDSPGSDWIAFNPSIAAELGWSRVAGDLFRWVDDNGDVMVESIWWTDGNIDFNQTGWGTGQVGSGWVVVASKPAFQQIVDWLETPLRGSIVVRESHEQSEPLESVISAIRPIEAFESQHLNSD